MDKSDLKALLRYAIKNNLMHKPLSMWLHIIKCNIIFKGFHYSITRGRDV